MHVDRYLLSLFICLIYLSLSTTFFSSIAAAQQTNPPLLLLANVLGEDVDVSQYLTSEKYDGVRAIWDGKVMRFRGGNIINMPDWFREKLPASPLDGELWMGRRQFDAVSGATRKLIPIDADWQKITYMVFEEPNGAGAFHERVVRLRGVIDAANFAQLKLVEQYRVSDRLALKQKLHEVVKAGGEGLMLHLADARYTTGRSNVLLKLKLSLDTEAQVLKHIAGKGKYVGMMGAITVKTPDGVVFNIGTGFSDAVRRNPPPIGATVTYTYRDLTKNGVPRFASFLRVRDDP